MTWNYFFQSHNRDSRQQVQNFFSVKICILYSAFLTAKLVVMFTSYTSHMLQYQLHTHPQVTLSKKDKIKIFFSSSSSSSLWIWQYIYSILLVLLPFLKTTTVQLAFWSVMEDRSRKYYACYSLPMTFQFNAVFIDFPI